MPSSWATRRTGENLCHDLLSKRSTGSARHTRALLGWDTTAFTLGPSCSCQTHLRGALHRFAHGLRSRVREALMLGTHDGPQTQTRRRASYHQPHGGAVVCVLQATSASGAAVGKRARCALFLGGCQGKACDRAAWAHSILVAAAKGRQQSAASLLLDLAKFHEHVGHDHLWEEGIKNWLSSSAPGLLVRFIRRLAVFLKPTSAPLFLFGPSGPFSQAAAGPPQRPNSCWQPSWKQFRFQPSRHTGFGMWSTTFRGMWRGLPEWFRAIHGQGGKAPG